MLQKSSIKTYQLVFCKQKKGTGLTSLLVNYWEINQITSKCQIDFLDKTYQKVLKVSITIKFYVFKLAWVPDFVLN